MAIDFSAFDDKVDLNELQKEVQEAPSSDFEDVPDGNYIVSIEKMELTLTKEEKKPMFAVQCKIKEDLQDNGQENRMIFFNRVVGGNKTTDKWNDGKAIKSVITWINKLLEEGDTPVDFINYSDFADQILDVFQSVQGAIEVEVEWAAKKFNPITIKEVYAL